MRVFLYTLFCLFIFFSEFISGQCPARDSVWNKTVSIRNSSSTNYGEKLRELLLYEKQLKRCSSPVDSVYTYLLLSIGVLYYRMAEYNQAIQYTKQALHIIQSNEVNPVINKSYLIKYYFYLSIYYDSLKMPSNQSEAIDSVIANELRVNSDYHFTSLVLETNVRDLFEKGDYSLCADRSTLGETLIHRYFLFSDSMNHIIYFIYYKANSLRSQKKYTEEEKFLLSKKAEFLKSKNIDYVGVIFNLFGYLYESRGEYLNAIKYFRKAFYFDSFSAQKAIGASVSNEIGMICSERLNQNRLALRYYYKALSRAQFRQVSNAKVSDSFYILGNIANVYVRMKLFDSAYEYFQMAFDKIKKGLKESDLETNMQDYVIANSAHAVIKVVMDKANACLQQYFYNQNPEALSQALMIYKTADRLLTKIRVEQTEIQSKLFWQSDTHGLYEHAVEVAFLQKNFNDAFYFFEKSRAVLLNDQLNQQNKITDVELIKLAELKKKILTLERDRELAEITSNQYINIQKDLILYKQALERLELSIKKNDPLYYQSSTDTSFITIKDVQNYLDKGNQQMLEIFSGDSAVYSLLLSDHHVYFNRIRKNVLDSIAGSYISYLSNQTLLNQQYGKYIETAGHLYQLIFQNGLTSGSRLIISPDGQIFPFEALVTNSDYSSPSYLLNNYAVSYTYSARYLLTDFNTKISKSSGNFLGIAPVRFLSGISLAALEGSDNSLASIGSYFSSVHTMISSSASKNNFQQQFSKYSIIQLYTHASDNSSRDEPVIYFVDSALYLSDLIPEQMPQTKLIVLSACETGLGKLYRGEGVFSFNRGFASLGIPSSITNLWAVDNRTTYQLTELFYKYLSEGLPIDIALRMAKLEFIKGPSKERRLPYYWAGTILAGKSEAIVNKRVFPWKDILLVLSLTTIAFFLFQKKKMV